MKSGLYVFIIFLNSKKFLVRLLMFNVNNLYLLFVMLFLISVLSVQIKSLEVFIFSSNGEGNKGLGGIRRRDEVFLVLFGHGIPIGVLIGIVCRELVWQFYGFDSVVEFFVVVGKEGFENS